MYILGRIYIRNPQQSFENVQKHPIFVTKLIATFHRIYGIFCTNDTKEMKSVCFVSYDELPESEKEYDRNKAMETLKLITKLGYEKSRKDKNIF